MWGLGEERGGGGGWFVVGVDRCFWEGGERDGVGGCWRGGWFVEGVDRDGSGGELRMQRMEKMEEESGGRWRCGIIWVAGEESLIQEY